MGKFLSQYGECDIVVDGMEALDAYLIAIKEEDPYDLICLDIMMPKVDGVKVLKAIRDFEVQRESCLKTRLRSLLLPLWPTLSSSILPLIWGVKPMPPNRSIPINW